MHLKVPSNVPVQRLDIYVANECGVTRSRAQRLILESNVMVNSRKVKPNYLVKPMDTIEIEIPDERSNELIPEDIEIDILHMDESVAVINKPPSMVVYPAAGHKNGTLMNALAFHAPGLAGIGGPLRPGIVHRLDKDTSGLLVVALTDDAYYGLISQFKAKDVKRRYLSLIYGSPKDRGGEIKLSIGRSRTDRKKMSTRSARGKEAKTTWEVEERLGDCATLVSAVLGTGRTHQIRVHMASMGHPVLGDKVYGRKTSLLVGGRKISFKRQMLHAEMLGFVHPTNGAWIEFRSPLPADMQDALKQLRSVCA